MDLSFFDAKMKKQVTSKKEIGAADQAFRLSRVYAEGWNAAKKESLIESDGGNGGRKTANPYAIDPQRSRWERGFADAMGNTKK
jgi:ribosome modulation factor